MPTSGLLSEGQRARFSALPEMDGREMVRHHTPSEADLAAVGVRRGAANRRLGFAVQLCLLRYPGRPLRSGEVVPRPVVGAEITDEHLRHLSPLGWEHIALTGVYRWDLGAAHGRLRPLRS